MSITRVVELVAEDCPSCGVVFGMPDYLMKARRQAGGNFYCPNGHGMQYGSENADLRKQIERLKTRNTALQDQADAADREAKRLRKRAAEGVCPCCHRTFVQLGRHMKTKHPEYAEATS